MDSNYPASIAFTLKWEGGKVNHPKDPGGKTNQGVIQRVFQNYLKRKGKPIRDVFTMVDQERDEIYADQYWKPVGGPFIPIGPDCATFDAGVNSGPHQGVKWLQRALGNKYEGKVDGIFGNSTAAACLEVSSVELAKGICKRRLSMYQGLKTWGTFGKGWARRISSCEATAVAMAVRSSSIVIPSKSKTPDAEGIPAPKQKVDAPHPAEVEKQVQDVLAVETEDAERKAAKATKNSGGTATGAAGSGGASTQVYDDTTFYAFIFVGIILLVVAGYFLWKRYIHNTRAAAYREEMKK